MRNKKPSAFVLNAAERLKKEVSENELWDRFKAKHPEVLYDFTLAEGLKQEYIKNPILAIRIVDLPVSSRTKNALKEWLYDVGELIQESEKELKQFRGFGESSLKEIQEYLDSNGLTLRPVEEENVVVFQRPYRK